MITSLEKRLVDHEAVLASTEPKVPSPSVSLRVITRKIFLGIVRKMK